MKQAFNNVITKLNLCKFSTNFGEKHLTVDRYFDFLKL